MSDPARVWLRRALVAAATALLFLALFAMCDLPAPPSSPAGSTATAVAPTPPPSPEETPHG